MPVGTIRVDLPFIYRTQKVGRAMRNGWGRAMRQFGSVMGARYESGACAREAHVSGEAEIEFNHARRISYCRSGSRRALDSHWLPSPYGFTPRHIQPYLVTCTRAHTSQQTEHTGSHRSPHRFLTHVGAAPSRPSSRLAAAGPCDWVDGPWGEEIYSAPAQHVGSLVVVLVHPQVRHVLDASCNGQRLVKRH